MIIISKDEYQMFGPESGKSNPSFISETEREVEAKLAVKITLSKLLTKMGKIWDTATTTGFMPKCSFLTISNKLLSLVSTLEPFRSNVDCRTRYNPFFMGILFLNQRAYQTASPPSQQRLFASWERSKIASRR